MRASGAGRAAMIGGKCPAGFVCPSSRGAAGACQEGALRAGTARACSPGCQAAGVPWSYALGHGGGSMMSMGGEHTIWLIANPNAGRKAGLTTNAAGPELACDVLGRH